MNVLSSISQRNPCVVRDLEALVLKIFSAALLNVFREPGRMNDCHTPHT